MACGVYESVNGIPNTSAGCGYSHLSVSTTQFQIQNAICTSICCNNALCWFGLRYEDDRASDSPFEQIEMKFFLLFMGVLRTITEYTVS